MKMKRLNLRRTLLLTMLTSCSMALTGCFNDDYDLNEVDMTVGVGGGELQIPTSSTDMITLDDVLDLNQDDCIELDANGNYIFKQDGGDVAAVTVEIDEIEVARVYEQTYPLEINVREMLGLPDVSSLIGSLPPGTPVNISDYINVNAIKNLSPLTVEKEIQILKYEEPKPTEIVDITKADIDAVTKLTVPLAALKPIFNKVKKLAIDLPVFMDVKVTKQTSGFTLVGNKLTVDDISTAGDLEIELQISGLDVSKHDNTNRLAITDDKILVDCSVHMSVTVDPKDINEATFTDTDRFLAMYNNANVQLSTGMGLDRFVIKGAQGYFNPSIELNDLGSVDITGVPDFLTDGEVVVDLYNPAVLLTLQSNLDIEGTIDGTVVAMKNGVQTAKVDVKGIKINAGADTKICLCRHTDDEALKARLDKDVVYYAVPELSTLIETIPDKIKFDAKAMANKNYPAHFKLGHKYTLKPSYSIEAPMAFAKKANIVYSDVERDFNDDVKDYELSDGAYLEISADIINHVPAFLAIDVTPVDINGRPMDKNEIDISISNTVIAYQPGSEAPVTPMTIILKQSKKGALKRFDGIEYKANIRATYNGQTVEGVTLNAKNHYIKADNIKVKLVGGIIADMN